MVGPTLIDIREHIEGLATEDGQHYVVCGRTGTDQSQQSAIGSRTGSPRGPPGAPPSSTVRHYAAMTHRSPTTI